MKNPKAKTMKTADIYRYLDTIGYNASRTDHIKKLFHHSALVLVDRIKNDGWKWRINFLREHAGCESGVSFTNSISPYIYELIFREHPGLRVYEEGD
jgi:hypothetical protein